MQISSSVPGDVSVILSSTMRTSRSRIFLRHSPASLKLIDFIMGAESGYIRFEEAGGAQKALKISELLSSISKTFDWENIMEGDNIIGLKQGQYVYYLYTTYGYGKGDIGQLFIAGFGSSMLFRTIVGSLADKQARKRACVTYCITYILSCITKHSPHYKVLMLGCILGGIATSLLFSAFESWLVAEHNKCLLQNHEFVPSNPFSNIHLDLTIGLMPHFQGHIF